MTECSCSLGRMRLASAACGPAVVSGEGGASVMWQGLSVECDCEQEEKCFSREHG